MLIKMLSRIAGPDIQSANPGDVISVNDARAKLLIEGGFAESVESVTVNERAVITEGETPESPRKRNK